MPEEHKAAKRGIPPKTDFNAWYPFIVEAAELVDKRYPIKGMDVWMPYGWKAMRLIDEITHSEMERTGHGEVRFPLLIPHNLLDKENALKKEESDLLTQKTILTKEEYQKRSDDLRKKVIDYQSQRRTALEKITSQRAEARQKLLEKLDPIMKTYIKENDISLIIDRKNVLMGNTNLDITNIIVEKLNKELPSLIIK